ncbi:hypothetical protein TNCV_1059111 [Trichonephila clavipes]|nr:hypothetical protein TNCV_1059111 [Trichonephila clavipes]
MGSPNSNPTIVMLQAESGFIGKLNVVPFRCPCPPFIVPLAVQTPVVSSQGTAMAGSDVVQSGRPIFDDFFQHLWPYIGNNTANVVFQMVKRLWLIRIDQ